LPQRRDLNRVRAEFLDTFVTALLPLTTLDRFKLAGVIATWWTDTLPDFKTLLENGFPGVIDGWVDAIADAVEDDEAAGPAFDPFGHKLVRRTMTDYLKRIAAAKTDIARLKGEKEAFEQSNAPDGLEEEELAAWNYAKDLETQVKEAKDDIKEKLQAAKPLTQRLLSERTPDIVMAMLQKYQPVGRKADGKALEVLPQPGTRAADKVAMTIVRKEKKPGEHEAVVEKEVTFTENIRFEEFPQLNDSEEILVLVDEAHRSHTRTLHRNLRKALPNAAIIGFTGTPILSHEKKETREIFGDFIDKYILQDAELDGATVPILYEGRTADAMVKDAPSLDAVFEDMFRDYSAAELAVIKAKYATEGDVMEAPLLIEQKARDIIRHYAGVALPEGFKAQVVATSRRAVMTYLDKLTQAQNELVAELEAVPAATLALPDDEVESSMPKRAFSYARARNCSTSAPWKSPPYSPGTTTTPSRGGTGLTRRCRRSVFSVLSGSSTWRRPTRPTRFRLWSL
jgi:type I restriction enzyme R subunit